MVQILCDMIHCRHNDKGYCSKEVLNIMRVPMFRENSQECLVVPVCECFKPEKRSKEENKGVKDAENITKEPNNT